MAGVTLTLSCTRTACLKARRHLGAAYVEIDLGLSCHDLSSRLAHRGTVETVADTLHQLANTWLAKARVGAGRADLLAHHARLDTIDQDCLVDG